ncbi:hypothetical protein [Romboutsia sp. 1001713B170131_170501_G6]|uniref:hypothetical protein n=1 Tax=Romboutsia sp. 1001713B170131_170501_G6 TaxID=2787108 RepID=UPI0018A94024|nr:hypothetical protein [Romboutsia sp. 1001713B170131_170501_G6]
MFFNDIFMDKDVEGSYSNSYDKMINLASRVFVDDSVDADRKKELYLLLCCAYGQLDDVTTFSLNS